MYIFYRDDMLTFSYNGFKQKFFYIFTAVLTVLSCMWDGLCSFIAIEGATHLIYFEAPVFITYLLIAIFYTLTMGRRGVLSARNIFSFAMLPCFIPAPLFSISHLAYFRSDRTAILIALIWIFLSRWPLYFNPTQKKISLQFTFKKIVLFIALQMMYGVALHHFYPSLLQPLRWSVTMHQMRPDYSYPTKSGIQFCYEDLEEAHKIEARLPEVVAVLKESPFFQTSRELVLIQKNRLHHQSISHTRSFQLKGVYSSAKEFSYFFTDTEITDPDEVYYSRNDLYRSVPIHELTHQLVARYYGKWNNKLFYSSRWKQEGYAEYMIAKGCYSTKAELAAIYSDRICSDAILEAPFSDKKQYDSHRVKNYMAAFLQTRYALDVKKISPIDFFKSSYKLASAQEIKKWLMSPEREAAE